MIGGLRIFSHLHMLLAFPYLIFKSRSAIRKVGLYTREYVVVWSFISTVIAFCCYCQVISCNLAPRGIKNLILYEIA